MSKLAEIEALLFVAGEEGIYLPDKSQTFSLYLRQVWCKV